MDEEIKEGDSYDFAIEQEGSDSDYDGLDNQENIDPEGDQIFTEI